MFPEANADGILMEKKLLALVASLGAFQIVGCSDKSGSSTEQALTAGKKAADPSKDSGQGATPPTKTNPSPTNPSNPGDKTPDDPADDVPKTPSIPVTPPVSVTPTPDPRQIISGWIEEYSDHVELQVESKHPKLLDLDAGRFSRVCPKWGGLTKSQRKEFWSALLWSIAGPESSRNRTSILLEATMSKDPVTGYQVRSEGLLQLSYQDIRNYKYNGGDILWEKDRTMAISDYNKLLHYGTPERTMLNAYANLNLGLFIMNHLLTVTYPTATIQEALGKYWFTMKSLYPPFLEVMMNMSNRMPACFK